jgi:hypothetical protein
MGPTGPTGATGTGSGGNGGGGGSGGTVDAVKTLSSSSSSGSSQAHTGWGAALHGGSNNHSFVGGPGVQTSGEGLSSTLKALLGQGSGSGSDGGRSVFSFTTAKVGGFVTPQDFVGAGGGQGVSPNLLQSHANSLGSGGFVSVDQGHAALGLPNLHWHAGGAS